MNHGDARGDGDADGGDGDGEGECEGGLVALGWSGKRPSGQLSSSTSSTRAGLKLST